MKMKGLSRLLHVRGPLELLLDFGLIFEEKCVSSI
jgi:hypothetical protein